MITSQKAWQGVLDLDWPLATTLDAAGISDALVWIPFDPKTGRNAVSPELKELASLRLPTAVRTTTLPQPPVGDTLVPAVNQATSHIPCWVFASDPAGAMVLLKGASSRAEPAWAVVDAVSGVVLGGRLPASRFMASLRLGLLILLILTAMCMGSMLVQRLLKWPTEWIRNCVVAGSLDLRTLLGVPGVLAGLGYLTWRLRRSFAAAADVVLGRGLPPWLIEPALRVDRAELRLPLDQRWRRILRVSGWVILVCLVYQFFFFAVQWRLLSGLWAWPTLISHFFGFLAAVSAIRRGSIAGPEHQTLPEPCEPGPACVAAQLVLRVMMVTLCGLYLGGLVFYAGVVIGSERLIHGADAYVPWAANLGALVGVALIPTRGRIRVTLSLGVLAQCLLDLTFDEWTTFILVAVVVLSASLPSRQSPGDTVSARLMLAARGAWSYSLGSAAGHLCGSLLGGVLIGPVGALVGGTVGIPVLASLGWLHAQATPMTARASIAAASSKSPGPKSARRSAKL
jgi:hypothetical protein